MKEESAISLCKGRELADRSAQSDRVSIQVGSGSLSKSRVDLRFRIQESLDIEVHTVAHHLLETSHSGRLEVNVAQDEAALCTELEGLYYAYSYDGGCLWPG